MLRIDVFEYFIRTIIAYTSLITIIDYNKRQEAIKEQGSMYNQREDFKDPSLHSGIIQYVFMHS